MVCWTKSLFVLFITVQILQTEIVNAQTNKDINFPRMSATFLEENIVIDGRMEESVWQKIKPVTHFIQGKPVEGAPAEEKTEVRALDLIRQRLDIIAEKADVECSFRLEPNKNSRGTRSQLILPIQKI